MYGISSNGKDALNTVVEDLFDRLALQFLGNIPRFKGKKNLVIATRNEFNLANLFIQAMSNKTPNDLEKDVLKSLLESSGGYIESLKNKTRATITERIDGLAREAQINKRKIDEEEVQKALDEEFAKAKAHMLAITEAESTKLRNLGSAMNISRVAAGIGDEDPLVYFVVFKDNSTCKECLKLHTINGGEPRVWKFSELKQGYHKRGEDNPSAFGLHPHCRCTLSYLGKGFGFKNGVLSYISENYDHYEKQRK